MSVHLVMFVALMMATINWLQPLIILVVLENLTLFHVVILIACLMTLVTHLRTLIPWVLN